jgi:hypothetical protein
MEDRPSAPAGSPPRRWPLFLIGLACFVLGPVIYAFQMQAGSLRVPWHWPALATLGVLCMAASAWRRPRAWRIAATAVFAIVCGLLWFSLGVATRTPVYAGPAQVGARLPAFAATYADGRAFTDKSLEDGNRSVLVFFRGRW